MHTKKGVGVGGKSESQACDDSHRPEALLHLQVPSSSLKRKTTKSKGIENYILQLYWPKNVYIDAICYVMYST